jgi:hypothetical protein
MKKDRNKIIVRALLALWVCFAACEKVIEPKDLPEQEPKLVLNCVVYAQQTVSLQVSSSKSIISGKDHKLVENADCDLYEDDRFVERLAHRGKGEYSSAYVAQTGKKYTLKVNASGYPGVEGSTSVPENVPAVRFERYDTLNSKYYSFVSNGFMNMGGESKFKVWIPDDLSKRNFYSVAATVFVYDSLGAPISGSITSYVYGNNNTTFLSGGFEVDDQVIVNGREVFLDLVVGFYRDDNTIVAADSLEVFLSVSNISEDLFKYKQTLNKQASLGASFFAEPVQVHNNVHNGMGIVASINGQGSTAIYRGKFGYR